MRHPHPDPGSLARRERLRRRGWWLIGLALAATGLAWVVLDSGATSAKAPAPTTFMETVEPAGGSQLSIFTLPSFTTFAHFAISVEMNWRNFSREPPPSSAP